jgi:hypothetical protein
MSQIIALVLSAIFSIASCVAAVLWDRRRLRPDQLARGWNTASFAAAVFAFAPLCIVAHFWVTRRSIRGILWGLLWLAGLLVAQVCFNLVIGLLFGLADP